jgi:hypothetical protein
MNQKQKAHKAQKAQSDSRNHFVPFVYFVLFVAHFFLVAAAFFAERERDAAERFFAALRA